MTKEEYKKAKVTYLALPAAIILLVIQCVAFMTGLHVGLESADWLLGLGMFVVLLVVQLIGNDLTWEDDVVFYVGWLFSYVVEISAGTWTFYNVFDLPNEYVRWSLAFGVSGLVAVLPERLIFLWVKGSGKRKVDKVSTHKPVQKYTPAQKYTPKQDKKPAFDFSKSGKNNSSGKPNDHRNIMSLMKNSNSLPTYRPLNSRFDESE